MPGPYVPLDVHYSRDRGVAAAGEAAELLYVRGLAYCKAAYSDGSIPDYELPIVAARLSKVQQRVEALVREELWVVVPGGWHVRSWGRWNESSDEQKAKRDRDAERQRRRRSCDTPVSPLGVTADVQRDTAVSPSPKTETRQDKTETRQLPPAAADAQTLVGEFIDACPNKPPQRVVGQVAQQVGQLLGEGINPEHVRAGLRLLVQKPMHPSSLPSLVNQAMNAQPVSTTTQRVNQGLALVEHFRKLEGEGA
jgi:hypothetical protein